MFVLCPAAIDKIDPTCHRVAKASKAPSLGIIRKQCVNGIFLIIWLKVFPTRGEISELARYTLHIQEDFS